MSVTFEQIQAAAQRIAPHIHRTPLLQSTLLNQLTGAELYFKAEHLQKTGAFKARGAHNAVFSLTDEEAARGVVTHSSGNHAAALALAAQRRGIRADIVMPSNASVAKMDAVRGYGGHIHRCEPTLLSRESTAAALQRESERVFIHPFDNDAVIAGQGTVGLEITEQLAAPADVVITPVGGGGLLAGCATAIKAQWPQCQMIGAEPFGSDNATRSFHSGERVTSYQSETVCDGLRAVIGQRNFELIKTQVDDIQLVGDDTILHAMRLVWSRLKQVIEPSAAVALALVLANPTAFRGKKVVVVLTGGNLDLDRLLW
ncbi:threonine/serine dehydratase [uncultured Ferrimonas sp.]|uniref:threonine/serine dehydratase n=1 Tax=uncultured Ferrimonas sp. TaxID=432640 RepID=UPI002638503E|nr:threonine/serine dehydratase [uncultured Ferrimonas sp.]